MDGCRIRRTKDRARKLWYALYRQVRFARWLGFANGDPQWPWPYGRTATSGDPPLFYPDHLPQRRCLGETLYEGVQP